MKNITVISKPLYPRNRRRKLRGRTRIWTAGGRAVVVAPFGRWPPGGLRGIQCSLLTMPGAAAVLLVLLPLNGYGCISRWPLPASDPAESRALPPTCSVSLPSELCFPLERSRITLPEQNLLIFFFPLYLSFRNIMPPLVTPLGRCSRVRRSFSLCLQL